MNTNTLLEELELALINNDNLLTNYDDHEAKYNNEIKSDLNIKLR